VQLSKDVFKNQGTYQLIPNGKNSLYVRFENLADRFDRTTKKTNFIDLQKFGNDLYKDVNGDVPESLSIMEVTL